MIQNPMLLKFIENLLIHVFSDSDEFDYMPEYSERVRYVMERFRDVEDFDAIALLATRNVTRGIFRDRMLCPATMLEMFAMSKSIYYHYLNLRLAPVLKAFFHQCVISYTCSQSNSDGFVLKSHQS